MIYHFKAEQTDAGLNFDINLDKNKQMYCFIGENAAGKTNLLENMAKTLICCHSMFKKEQKDYQYAGLYSCNLITDKLKDFRLELAKNVFSEHGKEIKNKLNFDSLNISLNDIHINEMKKEKERERKAEKKREKDREKREAERGKQKGKIVAYKSFLFRSGDFIFDNPLVFIGGKDRGYTQNIDKNHVRILGDAVDRFLESFTRSFNYISGKSVEGTAIADWFNSRLIINPNYAPQGQNRIFEVVKVLELLQELEPGLKNLVTKQNGQDKVNLYFREGKLYFNNIPIDKLATGYVAIIKIFQEIIAGYGGWTGLCENETDLGNVNGVVFIDEIESHLHPKWQYKIIPLLKKFFPKTTFYIATHSPAIVSTTDEGEAYELIREESNVTAKKLGNPKEWYLADVFSQAFHVDFDSVDETIEHGTSLIEMMKNFSIMVKTYTTNKDDELKQEIENLYQKILPSLADDDPRRRSVDSLKSLVK